MTETIIIAVIVAGAGLYVLLWLRRGLREKTTCTCDCPARPGCAECAECKGRRP